MPVVHKILSMEVFFLQIRKVLVSGPVAQKNKIKTALYKSIRSMFHQFRQVKFAKVGSILSLS
jgi:hypothetical protein